MQLFLWIYSIFLFDWQLLAIIAEGDQRQNDEHGFTIAGEYMTWFGMVSDDT